MATLRKRVTNFKIYGSDNDEDAEPYQSSGEEWTDNVEPTRPRRGRPRSVKGKKARRSRFSSEGSSEDSDFSDGPKRKSRNGMHNKRQKIVESPPSANTAAANADNTSNTSSTTTNTSATAAAAPTSTPKKLPPPNMFSREYSTGSFLILKKDAQVGDPAKHPCIWRVDGKALLQKYEAFEEDGKIRHKTTSVYTGWSALDREQYAPINVIVSQHNNQSMIVDMDWNQLKTINVDSD